ncbi:uncharacterized protein EI90DRAFT_1110023 [Cantharellus anzutake]|uniref:uncharacterized protein n=1 Tax=Cantharellus anzutake TaxID=1750568 RepID=UPI0019048279|nr:uncharacterized protein EI90DRAFT_1110023 [Cantharellus anzutake]KAF8330894.1 hypothetical protein EI90DRAFT_1110023 [Cantharellus anzutake]
MRRRCVVNCPVGDLLVTTTPWRRHALSTQRMSRFDSVMTRFELCSVWLPHCFGRTNEVSLYVLPKLQRGGVGLIHLSIGLFPSVDGRSLPSCVSHLCDRLEAASFLPRSVLDCRWLVSFGASLAEFSLQPWSDRTPKHPEAFRSQLRRAPNRSHLNPSQFFWPP